jgi:LPS export ABC transporter protein LptC
MELARLLLFATVALTLGLALYGCGDETPGDEEENSILPDHEIDGFTLTQTREGSKLWTLSARRALVFEEADRVELTTVRIDYFDEEGSVRSTMTSRNGLLMQKTNDMEAMGDVVLTASDGTVLTTQRLTWDERLGTIETDREVRVTKGRDVFTGVGVTADPDLKNIKVWKDFKAFVRTPEGELVEDY